MRAKVLTEDLLEVVQAEHAKVKTMLAQQQMELHQAQVQYAAYSAYAVCTDSSFPSICSWANRSDLANLIVVYIIRCLTANFTHFGIRIHVGICASATWWCFSSSSSR